MPPEKHVSTIVVRTDVPHSATSKKGGVLRLPGGVNGEGHKIYMPIKLLMAFSWLAISVPSVLLKVVFRGGKRVAVAMQKKKN